MIFRIVSVTICLCFVPGSSRTLRAAPATTDKRPNILWILADDLHFESGQFDKLPNFRNLKAKSLEFTNHVSQSPLCGPSRASMIVGRYPHNSGYKSQAKPTPLFAKLHEDSVGNWLTKTGYYTAFLGKYANGIAGHLGRDVPPGWRHFGAFTREYDQFKNQPLGGAYNYYNSSQWDLDYDESGNKLITKENSDYPINIWTGVHQADFLATQTIEQAKKAIAEKKPFFIFTNPAMIHHGSCEGPFPDKSYYKYNDPMRELFNDIEISPCPKRERSGGYLQSNFGAWTLHAPSENFGKPAVGQKKMYLWPPGSYDPEVLQRGRRNRTLSAVDLDEMVGSIMRGLSGLGVLENTYVIFTSDNGFHMGQHELFFGKELPYEHDIRVPMLIRTPKANKGVRALPTTHVDITRTIVDLAQAHGKMDVHTLDGKSFADALTGDVHVANWRKYSFSEMFEHRDGRTWRNLRFVEDDGKPSWSLHFWCSGEVEVYKLNNDPEQMLNVLDPSAGEANNEFGKRIMDKWMPVIHGMGSCVGLDCNHAPAKAISTQDLATLLPCTTD